LPQLLRNVRFAGASPLSLPHIQTAIEAATTRLGTAGRVLIRPSGTEPLIRVMAEGEDSALIHDIVDGLCAQIALATAQAAE
jgi:phosphoglucosamine mutase